MVLKAIKNTATIEKGQTLLKEGEKHFAEHQTDCNYFSRKTKVSILSKD